MDFCRWTEEECGRIGQFDYICGLDKNLKKMAIQQFSEQELLRRESMKQLRELGIEPYPAPLYPVNATAEQLNVAGVVDDVNILIA